MTRDEAIALLNELIANRNLRSHGLACEAVMRALYRHFALRQAQDQRPEGSEEDWALVGLLHDADYEITEKSEERHTEVVAERLRPLGVDPVIIAAIQGHADKAPRDTLMAKSIYAADELTGLIVAAALVRPDKKLAGLELESLMRRFREPAFARGANREMIQTCESELGIPLADFCAIALDAMKGIAADIGL
jgi:predicted hydrolase (HD superfamily)